MEEYIGGLGPEWTDLRDKVVRNSGIRTRHYAIDKQQRTLHTNASMAAEAVRAAIKHANVDLDEIDFLAAAASFPDLVAPGIASMVHGELGNPPCEIRSTHGTCSSGMMALKDAYAAVRLGEADCAVSCASEFTSRIMKASRFAGVAVDSGDRKLGTELAFMRYMLSDGAGAVVLRPRPAPDRLSLRVEWLSLTSYANTTELCSYLGKPNNSPDSPYWGDYPSVHDAVADGALLLRQELRLLPGLIRVCVNEYERLLGQGRFDPARLRYLGAHYSSEALRPGVLGELARRGLPYPPEDRWFTNLHRIGNIGCASIYAILEELYRTQPLEPGDQVLCFVPEAARYAISYLLLTAVGPDDA
ncbi:beta-ketoacyl synthase N-terminal-like domain-containing protein [Micromonospora sp. WMMD1120]|uniref:thiolase family protein n=1 Tax=Micromonospora sp. WMMD1120 TaxID=3016106 RepID=UPI002416573A|nr:3-oxoacyl-[acyl-carrier-protein] synthase III C-terminal domain-containing protein [Micromonospora sp. WMMD1120]MDG4810072.1 beta-ketoacyl synthase N-terminal-like domain-containing protein [Micromonospora sp. WMMD1120]